MATKVWETTCVGHLSPTVGLKNILNRTLPGD